MSKRSRKQKEDDEDYDPNDRGEQKRKYTKVSAKKTSLLCDLAIIQGLSVRRAGKKLRINESNAKVLVRKGRKLLQQTKIEAQSTVKVEPDVKMEFVEAESGAKLNESVPEMIEVIPYDLPIFYWPTQASHYPIPVVVVSFPHMI